MIKLKKGAPPAYLTRQKVLELTDQFKVNDKAVWREESIKASLLGESHNKCVYCESSIDRAGAGLEVEHFYPKHKFKDLVVDWSNLLASCRRCNTKKSKNTNIDAKEIINPFEDDPKDHLSYPIHNFRFEWKTELGKKTINQLDLNSQKQLVFPRFEVSDQINEKLKNEDIYKDDITQLRNLISDILELCQPNTEFSVISAYVLHQNQKYKEAKIRLEELGEWDSDMQLLHDKSLEILLDL